jgi:uncharacterized protein with GYD domain
MRYIILGKIRDTWIAQHDKRSAAARAKLKKLGIKLESVLYTQGPYDFVLQADAPSAAAILAFSIWYGKSGFGSTTTMPAFTNSEMSAAIKKV